jgi:AcrR family transcriptional regulator
MGRKSLAKERTEEILDAFERCIVNYGLEGTSLAQIAAEAEVKRSIIRHYIGNREAVVTALIERIMQDYQQQAEALFTLTREADWIALWLHYLFDVIDESEMRRDRIIGELLLTAKERYPEAKQRFAEVYEKLIEQFGAELSRLYPELPAEKCHEVAYTVLVLADAAADARLMGLDSAYVQMARHSAESVIRSIRNRN